MNIYKYILCGTPCRGIDNIDSIFARLSSILPFLRALWRAAASGVGWDDLRKYLHCLSLQLIAGNQKSSKHMSFFPEHLRNENENERMSMAIGMGFPTKANLRSIKMRPQRKFRLAEIKTWPRHMHRFRTLNLSPPLSRVLS